MRVLVTGGAGFIGGNLVRRLLEDPNTDVIALDDLSTGSLDNLADLDFEFHEGSVTDPAVLDELMTGVHAVVHLAARPSVPRSIRDPVATHDRNGTGTLRVLEAARAQPDPPYVVVASSSSVYGANPALPKSEDLAVAPLSPYAVSKLATEAYAGAYAASFGMRTLALRFFNVFGPLQSAGHAYAAVIPAFVDAALSGRPLTIHGDGRQSRDFTYVGSVTAVLDQAVRRQVTADGPINLAFGTRRTLLEVVHLLSDLLGEELSVEHTPARAGDVRHSQADQTRLRSLFPDVEPVEFALGLAETIDWFRYTREGHVGAA